jgi:hypothetical protein
LSLSPLPPPPPPPAAALTHLRLFVPRDRLPPPEDDEFYASDLVGLAVVDPAGLALGTVSAVVDYGAGDLLEIARPGAPNVLLPFTRAFVPGIDVAAGRLVADPPGGLFDEGEQDETARDVADQDAAPAGAGERRSRRKAAKAAPVAHAAPDAPPPPSASATDEAAPPRGKGKGSRWCPSARAC